MKELIEKLMKELTDYYEKWELSVNIVWPGKGPDLELWERNMQLQERNIHVVRG